MARWLRTSATLAAVVSLLLSGAAGTAAPDPGRHAVASRGVPLNFGFVTEWGSPGAADGDFNALMGVAAGGGDVLTVESGGQRAQRFTSGGSFLLKWGNPTPGGSDAVGRFNGPQGIATGPDGAVYVADTRNDRVQRFNGEGVVEDVLGAGLLSSPTDLAVDEGGNVYVADFGNSRVAMFDADGELLRTWGSNGTGDGQFRWISGVAVDDDGSVYTVESEGHRVQRFTSTGTFLRAWGSEGEADGQFLAPEGIAVGAGGEVWVVDRERRDLQAFGNDGEHLATFGVAGTGPGELTAPVAVTADSSGYLYVADNDQEKVVKIGDRGSTVTDTDGDALIDRWEITGLDVDDDGVVDVNLPRLGASPEHKDVFVEIDHMYGHAITNTAVSLVVDAFERAPVDNPDGSTGIRLHVDNGATAQMGPTGGVTWGDLSDADQLMHRNVLGGWTIGGYDWSAFDTYKDSHFDPARLRVFHYVISGHRYASSSWTSSGISRGIVGADLIVSLQPFCAPLDCSGTDAQQAGTLMHELGHNLGLHHGGDDDTNHKPTYLSVMNYSFQMSGLVVDGEQGTFDYSRFPVAGTPGATDTVPPLDEEALIDSDGIGAVGPLVSRYSTLVWQEYGACGGWATRPVAGEIDWRCDGTIDDDVRSQDVNHDAYKGTLAPYDDWPHLAFDGGAIGDPLGDAPAPPPVTTARIEPDRATLMDTATVAAGDVRRPRVNLSGKSGPRPVRVTLEARDNEGLARVVLTVDGRTRTFTVDGAGDFTRRVKLRTRGPYVLRALAIDLAGNRADVVRLRIRVT